MASDPYTTLGVDRGATQDAIQKAYRKLAKKYHPDLNPGDRKAEERFKEISGAYDLLGDPEKRARYDRGEIDESGTERPRQRYYRDFADGGGPNPYTSDAGFADFADTDDIISQIFGREGRGNIRMRGGDVHYRLELDFLEAINGAKKTLTLPDASVLDVTIPPGTHDGQILRLRGKGRTGSNGGPPGDALIELSVRPHPLFRREGDDIHIEHGIALRDAVLGGKVEVPTPSGSVTMTVPKWSNSGTRLRLKGRGVPRRGGAGDEYVTLRIMLPERPDPELEKFMAQWRPAQSARSKVGA